MPICDVCHQLIYVLFRLVGLVVGLWRFSGKLANLPFYYPIHIIVGGDFGSNQTIIDIQIEIKITFHSGTFGIEVLPFGVRYFRCRY